MPSHLQMRISPIQSLSLSFLSSCIIVNSDHNDKCKKTKCLSKLILVLHSTVKQLSAIPSLNGTNLWAPKDIIVTGMNPRGSFNKLHIHWMNHKLESRLLGEVSKTSDMQMMAP